MESKTADIEFEIDVALDDGPITLAKLEEGGRFAFVGDRRWLGSAIYNMLNDGRIVTVGCEPEHNHDGKCTIDRAGRASR